MTVAKKAKLKHSSGEKGQDCINLLPPELLLKIWQQLGRAAPDGFTEVEEKERRLMQMADGPPEPHPGLRSYPFLAQVCKHWKTILHTEEVCNMLWEEIVVDFGHELITAVHTPIAWSDQRPGEEEFKESFSKAKLDAGRILSFVSKRQSSLKRVVLMNSEGYYSEDGDFVNLVNKHDFTMCSFGVLCGLLYQSLESLTVMRCSDWFNVHCNAFATIVCLKNLKSLRIEDLQCRMDLPAIATAISRLTQLTELVLTVPLHRAGWPGLERIPYSWAGLTNLRSLTLRGHLELSALPGFFTKLQLKSLDVSSCHKLNIAPLRYYTSLDTLMLQGMLLAESVVPLDPTDLELGYTKQLPDLSNLVQLTALTLTENMLQQVPSCLSKLTNLKLLDLSCNDDLKIPRPLTNLYHLTKLELVNLKATHNEYDVAYWSSAKCNTMENILGWRKAVRRRGGAMKTLVDYGTCTL